MTKTLPVQWKYLLTLVLVSFISIGGYLFASRLVYGIGFPLDDAWIHQTYARNLALRHEWAFLPGEPSAGSTAPLWSALLAAGHALHVGPYWWTYVLGWLLLTALGAVGGRLFRAWLPQRASYASWVAVALILEWHMVWAAGSGMETLAFAVLILLVLLLISVQDPDWRRLGLLIGLSTWVRPDGLTLCGPVLLVIWFALPNWRERFLATMRLALGMALLVVPYLLFNRMLAGDWLPNTFFAKQAEYAIYSQIPLLQRYFAELGLLLVGVGALLFPGFLFILMQAIRRRNWPVLAAAIWTLGYLFMYAMRLPVTYQHARYIMPAMPVYFLLGITGMAGWIQPTAPAMWKRVIGRAWLFANGVVILLFWLLGARAYAQDVAIIESEMVATALWVAQNTPADALVAAHDIGALGYYADRRLLDLAGLVSPDVIPFIRDEERLAEFLDEEDADYLVTFPTWYPDLAKRGELLFHTSGKFSPLQGGENMAVYRWARR